MSCNNPPPSRNSGLIYSFIFISFFNHYWYITDTKHCVILRCTTWWLGTFIHLEMITTKKLVNTSQWVSLSLKHSITAGASPLCSSGYKTNYSQISAIKELFILLRFHWLGIQGGHRRGDFLCLVMPKASS